MPSILRVRSEYCTLSAIETQGQQVRVFEAEEGKKINWEHLSDFDLLLRLVDFSPLRPLLAHLLGWASARGWKPFDPVSIFLLIGWQLTHGWSRAETLRNLHNSLYAGYALRFGFQDGRYPTEGGLRYWLTALGQHSTSDEKVLVNEEQHIEVAIQRLNHLLIQSAALRYPGLETPLSPRPQCRGGAQLRL